MKKSIFLILFVMFASGARANIIAPRAWISEVLADSNGNWAVEMGFFMYDNMEIDSVRLVTSTGSSMILFYELLPYGNGQIFDSLAVITNANLANPLYINPEGDFVRLVSYLWGFEELDYVAFGNYPGSYLDCIQDGESVTSWQYNSFCIDNSPTIGEGLDSTGYYGNYSGVAYDLDGNPFIGGYIHCLNSGLYLSLAENGYFNKIEGTRRYSLDTIIYRLPPWPYTEFIYTVEPVDFCLRPDSTYSQDIITTSLLIGVDEQSDPKGNMVTVAPNPFSDKVVFYFNPGNDAVELMEFSIYSLDGKKIGHFELSPGQKRLEWHPSATISPGTYIYRLENNSNFIKTGKFVRL